MHIPNKFFTNTSDDEKIIALSFLQADGIPMHFYFKQSAHEYFSQNYPKEYDHTEHGWSLLIGQDKKFHLVAAVLSVDKGKQQIEVVRYEYNSGTSEVSDDSYYQKFRDGIKFIIPVNVIESVQVCYETKIRK